MFLNEVVTVRLLITSAMVLGGVAVATIQTRSSREAQELQDEKEH